MKKTLYFLPAFVVFALLINIHVDVHQKDLPSITLQNIEALSNSESPDVTCYGIGSVDCPNENIKVRVVI
jgi:hypothetical protein